MGDRWHRVTGNIGWQGCMGLHGVTCGDRVKLNQRVTGGQGDGMTGWQLTWGDMMCHRITWGDMGQQVTWSDRWHGVTGDMGWQVTWEDNMKWQGNMGWQVTWGDRWHGVTGDMGWQGLEDLEDMGRHPVTWGDRADIGWHGVTRGTKPEIMTKTGSTVPKPEVWCQNRKLWPKPEVWCPDLMPVYAHTRSYG